MSFENKFVFIVSPGDQLASDLTEGRGCRKNYGIWLIFKLGRRIKMLSIGHEHETRKSLSPLQ